MTLDELSVLDRLAAEKVMGWKLMPGRTLDVFPVSHIEEYYADEQRHRYDSSDWQPTRNIAQAWECLEVVSKEDSYIYQIEGPYAEGRWEISRADDMGISILIGTGKTVAEAIVRACLEAKGIEVHAII